jgi:hypothetical protein
VQDIARVEHCKCWWVQATAADIIALQVLLGASHDTQQGNAGAGECKPQLQTTNHCRYCWVQAIARSRALQVLVGASHSCGQQSIAGVAGCKPQCSVGTSHNTQQSIAGVAGCKPQHSAEHCRCCWVQATTLSRALQVLLGASHNTQQIIAGAGEGKA